MALTSREQKILYVTIAAMVLLGLNAFVVEPTMDKRAAAGQTRQELQSQVEKALATLGHKKKLRERWADMQENGLGEDVQKAEAMVYRYLEDCSNRSALELGSVQPDRTMSEGRIGEIDFVVSGTGSMRSVTEFLWSLETAAIPLKVKSYQLGAKNEEARVMTVQFELSTIYTKQPEDGKES